MDVRHFSTVLASTANFSSRNLFIFYFTYVLWNRYFSVDHFHAFLISGFSFCFGWIFLPHCFPPVHPCYLCLIVFCTLLSDPVFCRLYSFQVFYIFVSVYVSLHTDRSIYQIQPKVDLSRRQLQLDWWTWSLPNINWKRNKRSGSSKVNHSPHGAFTTTSYTAHSQRCAL